MYLGGTLPYSLAVQLPTVNVHSFDMIFRSRFVQKLMATACALGMVTFAQNTHADGMYQQTKNGKTMVWNSEPRQGDTATWAGDRNHDGYATGFGTLTWYTSKGEIYARYYGRMIDGKLDGPVNAHSKGKTAHATFAEGKRMGPWRQGNAGLRGEVSDREASPVADTEKSRKGTATQPARTEEATPDSEVTPPKKKEKMFGGEPVTAVPTKDVPVKAPKKEPPKKSIASNPPVPTPPPSERPTPQMFPVPSPTAIPKKDMDPSLQSLVGPPASLESLHRQEAERASSNAPLTEKEVVDLANTVAQTRGYDPSNYGEPEVKHNKDDNTWSLSYQAKEDQGGNTDPKRINVSVDGNTKRASLTPEP